MELDVTTAGKVFWCIYMVLWAAIRWTPNRRSRKKGISFTNRSPKERFSMVVSFTGLGIIPGIWVFTGFPGSFDHSSHWLVFVVGLVMLIATLRLFRLTHKALGAMWSHSLDLREGHRLVTSGIYEKVRHPMYSAFWLWAVSMPFVLTNWVAGFSGIVGFGTLYFLRVGQEEEMMRKEFGEEYDAYCAKTNRIVPRLL